MSRLRSLIPSASRSRDPAVRTARTALAIAIGAAGIIGLVSVSTGAAATPHDAPSADSIHTQRVDNGFAFVRGTDTLLSERWSRSPTDVSSTLTLSQQARIQFTLDLATNATVSRMRLRVFAPTGPLTSPVQEADARFRGDSLIAIQRAGTSADTVRRAVPAGAIPYLAPSVALFEQIIRRAKVLGGATVTVPVHLLAQQGGAQSLPVQVRYPTPDSAVVTMGNLPTTFRIAADGTILGIPAPDPSIRVVRLVR